ncbi:MAG: Nramp family divalent metal transporter [candidate division KSB1 bacterium]|nr:Nramp family divalent metal transporter [candidate division KSB1 bacterium]MDZ7301556.1 Nramp family divalent metal transporter [candidate division KSB1 bacterium]MDZ7311028.1 Nramp family divalent metal transporter [candidate division KSB1 bacterium]
MPQDLEAVQLPPKGLAILAVVGPAFVWCAEYIGSGEVILATRTGAILGTGVMWAIVVGIVLKYWIGMSGARYTVCTGEGMIDMISRMPGPKNWAVWIVLIAQFASAAISIGSLAAAAGAFVNSLVPISSYFGGWLVTIFAVTVVWTGIFDLLKMVMSFFVVIIVVGVVAVAFRVFPTLTAVVHGFSLQVPGVPEWALAAGVAANPWREILPLIGWSAGGFASQVWYTYWVMGAGYGATAGRNYGQPADLSSLQSLTAASAGKIKGWCRVVYTDATVAMLIGNIVTLSFLIAGAGILRPNQLAPEGEAVALMLSRIFSSQWGRLGGFLFLLSGAAALISTQVGQLAGWPRLLADAFRICIPAFQKKFAWRTQYRLFLVFFFCTNMILVYSFGLRPVFMVKLGALLDGLLLTPLQALWIIIGLYLVMPRMLSPAAREVLRPHWIFAAGLFIAFMVFGYFCLVQMPFVF